MFDPLIFNGNQVRKFDSNLGSITAFYGDCGIRHRREQRTQIKAYTMSFIDIYRKPNQGLWCSYSFFHTFLRSFACIIITQIE